MNTAPSKNDISIARKMTDLARERGSQSDDDLRAEGFTTEEIRRCTPLAAKMLRDADMPVAA
ncbi:hypothetical protein [Agrobacterium rosae]|uniref:hypothetical protein n=1 Tax=Agrobacterium rosae TaxID=1972867 RepID=UPI00122F0B47|nr:hypothetical protein [Agrobacterium rosae]KAA3510125.1 hypothetical protein DXM21_20055 [Agrobacterium rosae]KAA3514930.1 hypothetical protein DXM25_20315 [Agrobacterium rosae]MQB50746.1 hypothetical protein [Agrobacterium rosae]